jgi:V/A-type H+-transporting ATPase subunit I
MIEKMVKVRVVCSRSSTEKAVDALYEFGAIQITRSRQGTPDLPMPSFEEFSKSLIALRAAEKSLGLKETAAFEELAPAHILLKEAHELEAELTGVSEAEKKLSELRSEQSSLASRARELEPFTAVPLNPKLFDATNRATLLYFKPSNAKEFLVAAGKLRLDAAMLRHGNADYALVAVDSRKAGDTERELAKHGTRLTAPKATAASFQAAFDAAKADLESVKAKQKTQSEFLAEFATKHGKQITRVRTQLEEHAKKAELPNKFGRSTFVEIIEGWVPEKVFAKMQADMSDATGEKVMVERIGVREQPPTMLSNPPLIRRFEFLVRFFSLPQSGEVDPTLFIGVAFPIFFGMILGDIGYGALAVIMAIYLRLKAKAEFLKDIGGMLFLSAVSTIFFGIIYGEFFGAESIFGTPLPRLLERNAEGVNTLMVISLAAGVIHLTVGYLIGVYVNWNHDRKHAYAKLSWLALMWSLVLVVLTQVGVINPALTLVFGAIALIAVVSLYRLEGVPAVVEIPSLLSNVMSYLRLMALGMSGVILAQIINQIPVGTAFSTLSASVSAGFELVAFLTALATFIAFAALFIVAQGMALVLGLFESGIQSLRLQYVEFFSKFYHGGGAAFAPLRNTNNLSKSR